MKLNRSFICPFLNFKIKLPFTSAMIHSPPQSKLEVSLLVMVSDQVLTKLGTVTQLTANWSILDLASLPQQRISLSWKVNHGFNRNQSLLIILYSWFFYSTLPFIQQTWRMLPTKTLVICPLRIEQIKMQIHWIYFHSTKAIKGFMFWNDIIPSFKWFKHSVETFQPKILQDTL